MNSYQLARTKIQTGDCYGTFATALFSRLIRLFTKSKVSHVGIFIWIKNRLFCVETMEWKGCIIVPASNRLTTSFYWGKVYSPYKKEEIIENAIDEVGRADYSLVGAILAPLFDTKHSDNICSEYVARVLGLEFDQLNRGILPIDVMNKCYQVSLIEK